MRPNTCAAAHEATHALHAVHGKAPPAAFADKVAAGVTEEINTRANEVKIGRELFPTKGKADRDALDHQVAAGYMDRPLVERDIAPDGGLTYLENSAFSALLDEAQASDGITDAEATDIRKQLDNDPPKGAKPHFPMVMKGPPGVKNRAKLPPGSAYSVNSSYALVYTNRRIALATWQAWAKKYYGREEFAGRAKGEGTPAAGERPHSAGRPRQLRPAAKAAVMSRTDRCRSAHPASSSCYFLRALCTGKAQ